MTLFAFFIALGFAFLATPAQAAIRYVDKTTGTDTGPCTSPGTACESITYAIGQAVLGDDIKVATGTYTEGQIGVSTALTITGGYNPNGPTLWETTNYTQTPTILDGLGTSRPLYITADNAVIQYFTIQNGNATTAPQSTHYGGGVLVSFADATLRGLTIINNVASTTSPTANGGGLAFVGNATLLVDRTIIISNTSPGLGGGIGVGVNLADVAFLTTEASLIAHNSAAQGGAIATSGQGQSRLTLRYTTIANNNRGTAIEAILMTDGHPTNANILDVIATLLVGNHTAFNSTTDATVDFQSTAYLMDDITVDFAGNHEAANPAQLRELDFVNPTTGDYHLVAGSPAIDVGSSTARTDLDERTRADIDECTPFTLCPMGRLNDFGAYEYVNAASAIRYVAVDGSDNTNNCMDSAMPCLTPQRANEVVLGGDEIRLSVGTYTDPDGTCAALDSGVICIQQGITLTGGFTTSNWTTPSTNPLLTVVDGLGARNGIQVDYDAPTGSALVRNLTVRNGFSLANGAGISIGSQNTRPAQNLTLRNCRVEDSQVGGQGDGGGIYANVPVNLRIENCIIAGNSVVDGRGGGLAVNDANGVATYFLTNLTVYNNFADRPDENSANGGMGGGVFLQGVGTLYQSEIYSNVATFSGGGVATGSNNAHPILDRLYIHDNKASMGGGFSIFLTAGANLQNSLLVRNAATSTVGLLTGQTTTPMFGGNAIHSPYIGLPDEPLRVINVTIADNVGAVNDAIKVEGTDNSATSRRNFFTNVLISGNAVGIRGDGKGFAELSKVMMINNVTTKTDGIDPARLTGEAPLTGTPGFVGSGDYHLLPGADGVDDGLTVAGITQDLDGVSRPVGPAFDIGAYETSLQKQNQTITFAQIANRALADSPFTVQPTASSGLPVQLTSTTPALCTVNGYEVTLLAEGTCSLQAAQPGNATYNAAPTVARNFKIGITVPQTMVHLPTVKK